MDSNLIANIETEGFEDDFVMAVPSLLTRPHTHRADTFTTAVVHNGHRSLVDPGNGSSFSVSRQQSAISSISGNEYSGTEADLEAGLRRYSVHKDVEKASSYYARMHYYEERDETIKCIVSTILFVAIICLVLVYMFVANPQV